MFALDASKDGTVFMAVWAHRRLRKYDNLKNAVNGAVHLVKNQLNGYKVIGIKELNKDGYVCWVYADVSGKPRVEYVGEPKQNRICVCDKKESIENMEKPKNENRIEFLKKCHELHKLKKVCEKEIEIKAGNSVNNISDSDTQQKAFSFFENFMSAALDRAWKDRDAKALFRTELSLSAKGYSWYLDDDDSFVVKPTPQVLEILNKRKRNEQKRV